MPRFTFSVKHLSCSNYIHTRSWGRTFPWGNNRLSHKSITEPKTQDSVSTFRLWSLPPPQKRHLMFCGCRKKQERVRCCSPSFPFWRTLRHSDETARQLPSGTFLPPSQAPLSVETQGTRQASPQTSCPPLALSSWSYKSAPCSPSLTRCIKKGWATSHQGSALESPLERRRPHLPQLLCLPHLLPGCDWTSEGSWGCQSGWAPQSWGRGQGRQWMKWGNLNVSVWRHRCLAEILETVGQGERGGAEWQIQTGVLQTDKRRNHTEATQNEYQCVCVTSSVLCSSVSCFVHKHLELRCKSDWAFLTFLSFQSTKSNPQIPVNLPVLIVFPVLYCLHNAFCLSYSVIQNQNDEESWRRQLSKNNRWNQLSYWAAVTQQVETRRSVTQSQSTYWGILG